MLNKIIIISISIYISFFGLLTNNLNSKGYVAPAGILATGDSAIADLIQDITTIDRGLKVSGNNSEEREIISISGTSRNGASFKEQVLSIMHELTFILEQQGSSLKNVAEQVILLKDINKAQECINLMEDYYGDAFPATTFLQQPPMNGTHLGIDVSAIDPAKVSNLHIIHHNRFSTEVRYDGLEWLYLGGLESDSGLTSAFDQGQSAYKKMIEQLEHAGFSLENAVVFRNFVKNLLEPEINEGKNKTRYYWFCESRRNNFPTIFNPNLQLPNHQGTTYPAATGIGTQAPDLVLSGRFLKTQRSDVFIASYSNPYQTNPYEYAEQELSATGQKDVWPVPLFNRVTVLIIGNKVKVEVAGTAAIKGRENQFEMNMEAQAQEIINVFSHLFKHIEKELARHGIQVRLSIEMIKQARIYIKHNDTTGYVRVRDIYIHQFGKCVFNTVQADICYPKLLVEVECTIETTVINSRESANIPIAINPAGNEAILTAQ